MRASMRDGGGRRLVDQIAVPEAVEAEGRVDRMRLVPRYRMGEEMAGAGCRLEAAGAPAAIDVEARDRRLADDRRAVGRDVDDAAPIAQHPQAAEHREELANRLERMHRNVQPAALRIGDI